MQFFQNYNKQLITPPQPFAKLTLKILNLKQENLYVCYTEDLVRTCDALFAEYKAKFTMIISDFILK